MARAGILYSQVATAATKLLADGKNPTVDTVREALGATGSKSTIGPFLKRWKEEHQGEVAQAEIGIPATLLQAVKGIYASMQEEFQQKLDQAHQAHQGALDLAGQEAQRLRIENQDLAKGKDVLAATLSQSNDAHARLLADYQALQITQTAAQTENAGLQQRLADRAEEVAALNGQLTQSRTQFAHYQESIAAQRAEERQAAEQRITRVEQELAGARQQVALLQASESHKAGQLARVTADYTQLQKTAETAQREASQVYAEREQLAVQLKELSGSRDDLQNRMGISQLEAAETRTFLAVSTRENTLLAELLARAESRVETLAQEKLALLEQQATLQANLKTSQERVKSEQT